MRCSQAEFDALDALYIADGHHRSAAAARVAAQRRGSPDASHEFFLAVAFPHDEMRILDYNRVVRDLNGLSPDALLARIRESFDVDGAARAPSSPAQPETFAMYLGDRWYELTIRPALVPRARPRREPRRELAPGPAARADPEASAIRAPMRASTSSAACAGLRELERRVQSGRAAVAFALHPTRMEQLMAVADAGKLMPPKSTWFEPKLADGLLSHVLD